MKNGVLKKLSALSFELYKFEQDHKKQFNGLLERFNELQDEILKSKEQGGER